MKLTILLLAVFVGVFFWFRPAPFDWKLVHQPKPWLCASVPPSTADLQLALEKQVCFVDH